MYKHNRYFNYREEISNHTLFKDNNIGTYLETKDAYAYREYILSIGQGEPTTTSITFNFRSTKLHPVTN